MKTAAVAIIVGAVLALASCGGSETRTIVVPEGTYDAIESGDDVEVMPEVLELSVGDELRIVNEDVATHILGPYMVRPGETFSVTYSVPGEYPGTCSVNASKSTVIKVT